MAFDDPLKRAMNEKAAQPAFLPDSLLILVILGRNIFWSSFLTTLHLYSCMRYFINLHTFAVKFIYFEKAGNVKKKFQTFVDSSEYMNFMNVS